MPQGRNLFESLANETRAKAVAEVNRARELLRLIEAKATGVTARYGQALVASGEPYRARRVAPPPAPTPQQRTTAARTGAATARPARSTRPTNSSAGRSPQAVNRTEDSFNAPLAGLKALQHSLTLGQDDKIIAAVQTLAGQGIDGSVLERLSANLQRQQALSSSLRTRYPVATGAGDTVGMVAALATAAPAAAARAAAPLYLNALKYGKDLGQIPRLTATARQHLTTSAGASLLNAGTEAMLNELTGKTTSEADFAGSLLGGALGARATTATGPTLGAALEGFVTSATKDILNGREVSLHDASLAASNNARLGTLGDHAGTRWMERLPPSAKGKVGEGLSVAKRITDWDWPNFREVNLRLSNKKLTKLDPASSKRLFVESKAGIRPEISQNQLKARSEHPEKYEIDWWHHSDSGKLSGYLLGTQGSRLTPNEPDYITPHNPKLAPRSPPADGALTAPPKTPPRF
jgi:hypothetical protein